MGRSLDPLNFGGISLKIYKFGFRFEFGLRWPSKRQWKFFWQRRSKGFDDSETWSLDSNIARYVLPRLKRYREFEFGYPGHMSSQEEWNEIVDKMIFSFEKISEEDSFFSDQKTRNDIQHGLNLFGKYFQNLWW